MLQSVGFFNLVIGLEVFIAQVLFQDDIVALNIFSETIC